jgi:hypothetical protein
LNGTAKRKKIDCKTTNENRREKIKQKGYIKVLSSEMDPAEIRLIR